jgi:hypothetical protein
MQASIIPDRSLCGLLFRRNIGSQSAPTKFVRFIMRMTMNKDLELSRCASGSLPQNIWSQAKIGKTAAIVQGEFKIALETAGRRYDVVITEDEWASYLKRHSLEYPLPEKRSTSGRHENPSWRDVSVIVGAYLIKHMQTTTELVKLEHAAEQIFHLAKDHNIANPPAAATIKDHLSKILGTVETISIG